MHAWGEGRAAPGLLGSFPGEPSRPKLLGPLPLLDPSESHQNRFGVSLGCLLESLLAPFSSQVGATTVFEQSSTRNTDFSEPVCFSNGCSRFFTRQGAPRQPKIAPRRLRDRLDCFVLPLPFSLSTFAHSYFFTFCQFWIFEANHKFPDLRRCPRGIFRCVESEFEVENC